MLWQMFQELTCCAIRFPIKAFGTGTDWCSVISTHKRLTNSCNICVLLFGRMIGGAMNAYDTSTPTTPVSCSSRGLWRAFIYIVKHMYTCVRVKNSAMTSREYRSGDKDEAGWGTEKGSCTDSGGWTREGGCQTRQRGNACGCC